MLELGVAKKNQFSTNSNFIISLENQSWALIMLRHNIEIKYVE